MQGGGGGGGGSWDPWGDTGVGRWFGLGGRQ